MQDDEIGSCHCNARYRADVAPLQPHSLATHEQALREELEKENLAWFEVEARVAHNPPRRQPTYFAIDCSAYNTSCPKCGVPVGDDCLDLRSKRGATTRWVHPERFDQALIYHGLTPDEVTGEESRRLRAIIRWEAQYAGTTKEERRAIQRAEREANRQAQDDALAAFRGALGR